MAVLAVVAALLAPSFSATLTAPTHRPRVGTRWYYELHVTRTGKPVAARITAVVIDPLGEPHPVQYGTTKQKIVWRPIRGVFRDFNVWPREARGIPLTLRITVFGPGGERVVDYHVTPR